MIGPRQVDPSVIMHDGFILSQSAPRSKSTSVDVCRDSDSDPKICGTKLNHGYPF